MASSDRISTNDARILEVLQRDGRRAYADLGADVGMSGPSAHERVKKLEARGVIRGYAAIVDPAAIGYDILAFSWVTQAPGTTSNDLTEAFASIPEIEECHHITGEADYLIKVRARDTRDLERVLRAVQATPHVYQTETDVVFSSGFELRPFHVPAETDDALLPKRWQVIASAPMTRPSSARSRPGPRTRWGCSTTGMSTRSTRRRVG